LFPACCRPVLGRGVFVLCVTCIGELGPRRTGLSGNPAQRYLRLLVNVAKKCRGRGPPFSALSQEGNASLVRTVDWFDPERGLRDCGRAICLPLHEGETASPRPTPPARRSPPNLDATPALGNLQDASARGGSRRRPLGAGGSHWTLEARGTRRRGLRRAGLRARGFDGLHDALLEGGLRGLVRDHLGGPRRRPPLHHAAGTHSHRPLPRDRRPPSQKRADVAEELDLSRVRQLQRRVEDALRAETPADELGSSRRCVSPSPPAARDFRRISILT